MDNEAGYAGNNKKPFRVLSLDGGGMRGLYSATLLQVLARRFDGRFNDNSPDIGPAFDLICGTSTGAILACGLASGISLNTIRDLYIQEGSGIFPNPSPKKKNLFWWCLKHHKKPAAVVEVLRDTLEKTFGDMTIGSLFENRKIAICIPTVSAINHKARVIKTPHLAGKHRDNNYRIVDACLASAAAPIFFPLAKIRNPDDQHNVQNFVDGGLWANNPIMIGLIEALTMTHTDTPIELVSVGTCDQPTGDPSHIHDNQWGIMDWRVGVGIVEMAMSAQSSGYGFMAKFLAEHLNQCGRNIHIIRLEESKKSPEQYSAIGLDRADKTAIDTLVSLAEADADLIHSKAMSSASADLSIVKNIFSNLTPLETRLQKPSKP